MVTNASERGNVSISTDIVVVVKILVIKTTRYLYILKDIDFITQNERKLKVLEIWREKNSILLFTLEKRKHYRFNKTNICLVENLVNG